MLSWLLKLLPTGCVLCQQPNHTDLCDICRGYFVKVLDPCQICGNPNTPYATPCGNCLKKPPDFDRATAPFLYRRPLSSLILQLKFHERLSIARVLGCLLADHCLTLPKPDYLIPVPLHQKRLRTRGFNQALELALILQKHLNIPIARSAVIRTRHTSAQMTLAKKDRLKNLKRAFQITRNFRATHVAIIDDVLTTGTTVNEIARVLKKHGVQTVQVWTIART